MEVFGNALFPFRSRRSCQKRYQALLGLGGNVGDVENTFKKLIRRLQKNRLFCVQESSILLKNPPFGYKDQPDFINSVLLISTSLSYYQCFKYIMYTEKRFKRVRKIKNGPRTLDIDILFFGGLQIKRKNLIIPHPKWHERSSVTIPISFLKGI